MSSFTSKLIYEHLGGGMIRIAVPFEYRVGGEDSDEVIRVPEGFECDGQSYPRLLWMIDTPQGEGAKAGVIHDFLYWMNGRPMDDGRRYDRKAADQSVRDALVVSGVAPFRAAVRYRMLRIFGGLAWKAHTRRIKKESAGKNLLAD
jgi:hypothetical protein